MSAFLRSISRLTRRVACRCQLPRQSDSLNGEVAKKILGAPTMLKKPVEMLLVEDEGARADAFRNAFEGLTDDFRLTVVGSLGEALDWLSQGHPDLVVASLRLPDGKGTDLLTSAKESAPFPLVVITASGSERDAVEVMKAGALDYAVMSPEAFTDMPQIARRALREWKHTVKRRKAERAMLEENSKARKYLDAAAVIIVSLDTACMVKFINQRGASLLGWSHEKIIGQDWVGRFVPERRRASVRRAMSRAMGGERDLPSYVEDWIVTKNGQERLIGWHNTFLTDPTGSIIGTLN
jgi:PAS domain S-box-containing protein